MDIDLSEFIQIIIVVQHENGKVFFSQKPPPPPKTVMFKTALFALLLAWSFVGCHAKTTVVSIRL